MTEILENVKDLARRRRQGYYNISMFSSKTAELKIAETMEMYSYT